MRLAAERMLVDEEGTQLAWFPSYTGGPSQPEACANARLGAGEEPDPGPGPAPTPGPWRLWPEIILGDLLIVGPDSQIVAQLKPAANAEAVAVRIIALRGSPSTPTPP